MLELLFTQLLLGNKQVHSGQRQRMHVNQNPTHTFQSECTRTDPLLNHA